MAIGRRARGVQHEGNPEEDGVNMDEHMGMTGRWSSASGGGADEYVAATEPSLGSTDTEEKGGSASAC